MHLLPCCTIRLKAQKPKAYPENPGTLGGHLRKRRHALRLYQKDAAAQLGVNQWTYVTWELDKSMPVVRLWPKVIKFLGYYPFPEPQSLAERLLAARRHLGVCHRKAAQMLCVDEGTYLFWEQGKRRPSKGHQRRIERFLSSA